jgi:hypothetical protein
MSEKDEARLYEILARDLHGVDPRPEDLELARAIERTARKIQSITTTLLAVDDREHAPMTAKP